MMQWYRHDGGATLQASTDIHDGDSMWLTVHMAFYVAMRVPVRLFGVDTPELNSPDPAVVVQAKMARDRVRGLIQPGVKLGLETFPFPGDKYRRWLARIYLPDGPMLNDLLVEEGLAVRYNGGTRV